MTDRTYAAHAKPLWQRALLTREFAVIALLVAVFVYSRSQVPAFGGPLTLYYLLLDTAAILLIALP
ncbi:MAG: ABC transporter permease, partial [Aeromicrobium sp.]